MNELNLLTIVVFTTVFISLFLVVFLLTVKTTNRVSNILFAFFLLLTVLDMSDYVFDLLGESVSNLEVMRNLAIFLQLPTLLLYILSVCYADFKLQAKHLWHIVPFIIANLVLTPRLYLSELNEKIIFLTHSKDMVEMQFNYVFFHLQVIAYLVAIFLILRRSKKLYLENFAGASLDSFKWLFQLTFAISLFYGLAMLKNAIKFSAYEGIAEWLKISMFLLELVIISWYLLKALNNPTLFKSVHSKLKLVETILSEQKKLLPEEKDKIEKVNRLKDFMSEEKPFLDPTLTIQNVSDQLGIPVRELSLLINHQLNKHFFDFVNEYRIEKAKETLSDPTKKSVTVLEILYQVGFNSKSSFNTAFKKQTGITPTAYRKNLINKAL